MSSYVESYAGALRDGRDVAALPAEFVAEYPALAVVLAGQRGSSDGRPEVSAATINLWFEGGDLHFCIMPRFGNRVAFGVVQDPVKGFAGLDAEVEQGRYGWKISKSRKPS